MRINSTPFFIFLSVAALLYRNCRGNKKSIYILCVCNLLFYASFSLRHIPVLLFIAASSYFSAVYIDDRKKGGKKIHMAPIVIINLLLLLFYKYAVTVSSMLGIPEIRSVVSSLTWPLGLSFYTFAALGYVMDVYMGKIEAGRDFAKHLAFVGFFPVISSGPIMRYSDFSKETEKPRSFDYADIEPGMIRMLWGLEKKLVVADGIGKIVDSIYSSYWIMAGPFLCMAAILYTLQIYCDFSGYSDIAIGAAKVMGINVKENFLRPFLAQTYSDFWARWHISLTGWFKDYLFTPLAFTWPQLGSFSMFIIYPISGIWHGAGWSFIIWGALNGAMLVFGRKTAKKRRKMAKNNPLYKNPSVKHIIQSAIVFLLFTVTLIFFRLTDIKQAFRVLAGLFRGWGSLTNVPGTIAVLKNVGLGRVSGAVLSGSIALVLVVELQEEKRKTHISEMLASMPATSKITACYFLLIMIMLFGNMAQSAYIYNAF